MVSVLKQDGTPLPRCATVDGAVLQTARQRKMETDPGLIRMILVVLVAVFAGEVVRVVSQFRASVGEGKSMLRASSLESQCNAGLQRGTRGRRLVA